jgi:proline iminopeptidase
MKVAVEKGHRVLLMDQRGTGSSTAMSVQRLLQLEKQGGVELQAHYLTHMRSDAIAEDVEVRIRLL